MASLAQELDQERSTRESSNTETVHFDLDDDSPRAPAPPSRPAIRIELASPMRRQVDALDEAQDLDGLIELVGWRPGDGYAARRLAALLVRQGRIAELRAMAKHSPAALAQLAHYVGDSASEDAFAELVELSHRSKTAAEHLVRKYLQREDLSKAFDLAARSGNAQTPLVTALRDAGDVAGLQKVVHAEFRLSAETLLILLGAEHPGQTGELDVLAKLVSPTER